MYLKWLLIFPLSMAIKVVCLFLSPIALLFTEYTLQTHVVKRQNKKKVSMMRRSIIGPLKYFSTHDKAVDEWWYGMYNKKSFGFTQDWTQEEYDGSALIRYFCSCMWLWRNSGYGFLYAWFSHPKELEPRKQIEVGEEDNGKFWLLIRVYKKYFQLEAQIPLFGRYLSPNFGWKAHKRMDNVLYAPRLITLLRSY
jgi:hypothetical protein